MHNEGDDPEADEGRHPLPGSLRHSRNGSGEADEGGGADAVYQETCQNHVNPVSSSRL